MTRIRVKLLRCLLAGLLVAAARLPAGSPPEYLSFQSTLVDSNGGAIGDDNYTIYFRIYDASQGGNLIWSESQLVTVSSGYFSVFLGQGSAVAGDNTEESSLADVFKGANAGERYVGITVSDTGTEISPRLQLLTSPYSFLATQATKLVDSSGNDILDASSGTVSLPNGAKAAGTLTVTGKLSAADDVSVGGGVAIDETLTAEGLMTADGGLSTTTLVASGAVTANSTITAGGEVSANGGLRTTTLDATDVIDAQAGLKTTTLSASGAVTADSTITAGGKVTANAGLKTTALEATGAIAAQSAAVSTKLTVSGDTTLTGLLVKNPSDTLESGQLLRYITLDAVAATGGGDDWGIGIAKSSFGSGSGYANGLVFSYGGSGVRAFRPGGDSLGISDRRLKKDITEFDPGTLDKITQLNAVTYRMKTQTEGEPKSIGFVAQDVQQVFPELTSHVGNYIGVAYERMGVVALAGLKELKTEKDDELTALRKQNELLTSRLNEVVQRLQALESRVK